MSRLLYQLSYTAIQELILSEFKIFVKYPYSFYYNLLLFTDFSFTAQVQHPPIFRAR